MSTYDLLGEINYLYHQKLTSLTKVKEKSAIYDCKKQLDFCAGGGRLSQLRKYECLQY